MNLFRALGTVSGFTLLSRVTGLARDLMTASLFGAGALTDAFFVAFRLPNLLRRMFAEGAFSSAFVPALAATKARGDDAATQRLLSVVATALFWSLLLVTVIGVVAAPSLIVIMASGLRQDPATFDAAVVMARWMFPYILMISLVAFASGVLNTWKHFALPAFAPVLLNLSFIGFGWFLKDFFNPPIYALAGAVVVGGIAQLAIQIPALKKRGLLPRIGLSPFKAFAQPEVRAVLGAMAPTMLAVSVAQISLIINTHLASRIETGAVSWITYADRLMEFPTAMLGVALGVILTPSLTAAHQRKDQVEYNALLDWGLRICVLLAVPAMIGLGLLAEPLTAMLFHYGKFAPQDVLKTSQAVAAYGLGILGLTSLKILAPGFFARQDTRTPVKIAIAVLIFTQAMNFILVPMLGHSALALSISLGATLNAGWMLFELMRQQVYKPSPGWLVFLLSVAAAAAAMAFALSFVDQRIDWVGMQSHFIQRIATGLAIIASGAAIYFGVLMMLGIDIIAMLKKKTKH
jgi:putative peptidoglycan lipid II flippase